MQANRRSELQIATDKWFVHLSGWRTTFWLAFALGGCENPRRRPEKVALHGNGISRNLVSSHEMSWSREDGQSTSAISPTETCCSKTPRIKVLRRGTKFVARSGMTFASRSAVKITWTRTAMLRITVCGEDGGSRTVKLEGKLLEAWIDEVRCCVVGCGEGRLPTLDLSGLRFVDRHGAELLEQLLKQGVRIRSCSPFVAELLDWDRNPND